MLPRCCCPPKSQVPEQDTPPLRPVKQEVMVADVAVVAWYSADWKWPQSRATNNEMEPMNARSTQSTRRRTIRDARFASGLVSDTDTAPERLEGPVLVFGVNGLADHVRRARAGEEVVILVGVGRQRRQDRRVHIGLVAREQRLVAEIHQRLVRVVAQELLDVLGQPYLVVEVLGVLDLVVVELEQQLVGVVLELGLPGGVLHGEPALVLVADVV